MVLESKSRKRRKGSVTSELESMLDQTPYVLKWINIRHNSQCRKPDKMDILHTVDKCGSYKAVYIG